MAENIRKSKFLKLDDLDCYDQKLLELLSSDSRLPYSKLGKLVNLKKDTVAYRIKRLKERGLIKKLFAEPDLNQFGVRRYHVFLLIDDSDEGKKEELIEFLKNHPNTISVFEYSDKWDIEWIIGARRLFRFDSFVTEVMNKFSDIIIERSKLIVIKSYYSTLFPSVVENYNSICKRDDSIDEKDIQIISRLSKDSRLSTYEIAKEVNLSADAIGIRIKKLKEKGLIRVFTAQYDLSTLGYNWYTFVVRMKKFSPELENKLNYIVNTHPNILHAVKTIGHWDYLFNIVAKDQADFHATFKFIKREFSHVVRDYSTFFAYKEHIFCPFPKVIEEDPYLNC